MKKIFRDYSLSIVLGVLFLLAWSGQFITQVLEEASIALQHGQEFTWSEFLVSFGSSTLENWQSEFLQLLSMVVLTSFLIHKGSAESRDSTDEILSRLKSIEEKVNAESKKNFL